jgi:hypothetical protein
MAKATSASPATSTKEPPLLGRCVPGLLLLAPAVGLKEALAVGVGEPLAEALAEAEPLAEALAEALAEPLAPLTETVAVI